MSAPYDYTQQFHPHHGQGPPGAPGAPDPYGPPQSSGPYAQPPPGTYPPPNPYPAPYGAPPPAYGGYPPPYGQSQQAPVYDEVRTIFITGFPADVKERELNNLLRFVSGYEASQMNWKNGQAQGFAIFSSGSLARSACDVITQLCFDESSILRCEMARKNMYIKEDPSIKRPRTSGAPYGGNSSAPSGSSYSARPSSSSYPPQSSGGGRDGPDNPPCNTLFIGNLADTVNEAELRGIFGGSPAFKFIKVVRGPRSTTCFVEYEDVASAQTMHAANQGVVVASSDKGPLRVQYAKNPYGKKRDMTGALIDTTPRDYPAPGTN